MFKVCKKKHYAALVTEDYRHHLQYRQYLGSLAGFVNRLLLLPQGVSQVNLKTSSIPYCLGSDGAGDDHCDRVEEVQLESQSQV